MLTVIKEKEPRRALFNTGLTSQKIKLLQRRRGSNMNLALKESGSGK